MERLKMHLDKAYSYLSGVQVCGDAVDALALARAEMRMAWKEACRVEETTKEEGAVTGETEIS